MSVILVLTHVTDEQIQALLALPRDQRLQHYQSTDFMTSHDQIDLDKAWHGIHFVLTGTSAGGTPPACYLLTNGLVLGPSAFAGAAYSDGMNVGEADRALTSAHVRAFSQFLEHIDDETFRQRFAEYAPTMQDIYPGGWDERPAGQLAYLLSNFHALRDFVRAASSHEQGVLLYFA